MKPAQRPARTSWMPRKIARNMSVWDFASMDRYQTLYVRPVADRQGAGFAVFAGDGTYLDTVDTLAEVTETAQAEHMDVVSVH